MNEYDSNRIYDLAKKINYEKTDSLDEADCYVLNTCHIREKATDKVYHDIGRVKKNFRNKKKPIVIITGCVAQAEGDILLMKDNYIDAVIGPQSSHNFNETIIKIENKKKKLNFTNFDVVEKFDTLNSVKNSCNGISSFLTIQEGCDKFCKFCVVPYTRGAEYSRSLNEIVKECKNLVDNGSVEITLLGQNVNAYNFNGKRISDLVYELSKINHLKRIRYTTSHPVDFTKDLVIAHSQIDKLMPLIHLPIQSGSNNILEQMNRKHSIEEYLEVINQLLEVNSLIKFSSDFIIGYPGETDRDFEETLKLLKKIKYINSYSYIFSPRPGTPSAKMKFVDNSVSKRRLIRFQKLADEIKLNYKRSLINKQSKVLFENKTNEKNEFFGRDEFNNSVIVKSDRNLIGKIEKVKILNGNQNSLFGEIYTDTENKVHAA
tara:strand:- start:8258 stop:9553 length:1296 start_codon:yes stop_codon:yes gene_type:complete